MARFRFVFRVDSHLRLMEKAAGPPGVFRFELSPTELVVVRDVVGDVSGVPLHRGLNLQVTIDRDALDDAALAHAIASAETTLILLSGAARAPTGDSQFQLAYEITTDSEDCAFLQHLPVDDVPAPGTPVSVGWLEHLWTAIHRAAEQDVSLAQRVILSMSWYRRALREAEELFRFNNLWLACEGLNPRLCDHYAIPKGERSGLPGLRRLLDDVLEENETFRIAVGARNDLLHVNRVLPDAVRQRVGPIIHKLDKALLEAWRILLDIPESVEFAPSSVRPFPYKHVVRGTLRPDAAGWSEDRHPYLEQTISLEALEPDQPGDIKYNLTPKWTLRNANQFKPSGWGLSGSDTPSPFNVTSTGEALVIPNEASGDNGEERA